MTVTIHDRRGNPIHVPPTLPRLDMSQREFMRQQFAVATDNPLIATHLAALGFLDRLPETPRP